MRFGILFILEMVLCYGAMYKRARSSVWVHKEGEDYTQKLGEGELAYKDRPHDRFAYLSRLFSALMTVEDVDRAYKIVLRLRGWGKWQQSITGDKTFIEKADVIHRQFDLFLLNLRNWEQNRKDRCPSLFQNTIALTSNNSPPINSPCTDIHESAPETISVNQIFNLIIHQHFDEARTLLDAPQNISIKPRLFKIEMVLLIIRLETERRMPCMDLWEEAWNIVPFHKYKILDTYSRIRDENLSPILSEDSLKANPRFKDIRDIFPQTVIGEYKTITETVIDRIGLAIGNKAIESRLAGIHGYAEGVAKCRQLNEHQVVVYQTAQQLPVYQRPIEPSTIKYVEHSTTAIRQEPFSKSITIAPTQGLPVSTRTLLVQPHTPVDEHRIMVPQTREVHEVIQPPRTVLVVKQCNGPDYRHLMEIGQAYRRGLQYFMDRHHLTLSEAQVLQNLQANSTASEPIINLRSKPQGVFN